MLNFTRGQFQNAGRDSHDVHSRHRQTTAETNLRTLRDVLPLLPVHVTNSICQLFLTWVTDSGAICNTDLERDEWKHRLNFHRKMYHSPLHWLSFHIECKCTSPVCHPCLNVWVRSLPAIRMPKARHSRTLRRASPAPIGRLPVPMAFSHSSSKGFSGKNKQTSKQLNIVSSHNGILRHKRQPFQVQQKRTWEKSGTCFLRVYYPSWVLSSLWILSFISSVTPILLLCKGR